MSVKNPILEAWERATYEEQIAFRNLMVKRQNVLLCKQLRIMDKCLLKTVEVKK